jgi:radical SAM superfamily enzyme YgiQ (UPF0313 family)
MVKVVLVNPAECSTGYSFITPRWLFVIAQATPVELVGDPVIVDESIERFNPACLAPGDIVGIGISSGNCRSGYAIARAAKSRGATVIMGGIHATLFPDEAIEMGSDAAVTGNGELVWKTAVHDAIQGTLKRRYDGGRAPGNVLGKARWDLIDPRRYLFPSVQTVAGCPENCSFCSVWVTDGRRPRPRLVDQVIEEVTSLYNLGFRFVIFADDNFTPATLGRIAREPSASRRKELEELRAERLRFFEEYDRRAPRGIFGCTQMTAEAVSDPEYLSAMYHKMRIRQALVGVESYSREALNGINKRWNPAGEQMIEAVRRIQATGIVVLTSIICGLESDTADTLREMRRFAVDSGAAIAQFTIYNPLPGTKDYYEMMADRRHLGQPGYIPKHKTRIVHERYWLISPRLVDTIQHPNMTTDELVSENRKCWDEFYSAREILRRVRTSMPSQWSVGGRIAYFISSIAFRRIFAGHGVAADSVRKEKLGLLTRALIKVSLGVYNLVYRNRRLGMGVDLGRTATVAGVSSPDARLIKIETIRPTQADAYRRRK